MSITNKLNQIKNAIYGKEVRGAIHDAIKECYDDASVNHDNANMEVKMARGTHNTLNERLNKSDEIQAQTNAQLSDASLKIKHLKIINIADYGAKGDGVNDDTLPIKNALLACGDGDVLYFPKTTNFYKVDGSFQITKEITLKGNQSLIRIIGMDTDGRNSNLFNSGRTALFNVLSDNVVFDGIHIDINSRNNYQLENGKKIYYASKGDSCYPNGITAINTNESATATSGYNNLTVVNCVIENASSGGISPLGGANHKILNNTFKGNLRDSISVHFGKNITIENNKLMNNLWHGIHLYRAGNENIKIKNNEIDYKYLDLYPTNQDINCTGIEVVRNNRNITIEGNTYSRANASTYTSKASEYAILLLDYDRGDIPRDESMCVGLSVSNNTIKYCVKGIHLEKPGRDFIVENNTLKKCEGYGIYVNMFNQQNGLINNNKIIKSGIKSIVCDNENEKTALYIRQSSNIKLTNNTINCGIGSEFNKSLSVLGSSSTGNVVEGNICDNDSVNDSNTGLVFNSFNSNKTKHFKKETLFTEVFGVSGGTTFFEFYVGKGDLSVYVDMKNMKTRVPNTGSGNVLISTDSFYIGKDSLTDSLVLSKSTNSETETFSNGGTYNASQLNLQISEDTSYVGDYHKIKITGSGVSGYFITSDVTIVGNDFKI